MSDKRDDLGDDIIDDAVGGSEEQADTALVPTGKAGRGSVGTLTARTDADQAEDTEVARSSNPIARLIQYIREIIEELRKVIWPTRHQMIVYTAIVFVFLIFMTAVVSGVDYGAGRVVELIFGRDS